jgi:hypothetical protein
MPWHDLDRLILVAGHAVYTAEDFSRPGADESWRLEPFQKGEPPFYIEHIRRGVELAAAEPRALLVFSGGQSRADAGPKSEAQSYWTLADHYRWSGAAKVRERATTEEFARDSFENLLFGICRFRECAGRDPETVTVVSWEFKRERFDLHRETLGLPPGRFVFVGANNPTDLKSAVRGEASALALFRADPWGDGPELSAKRDRRNPFRRRHAYEIRRAETDRRG